MTQANDVASTPDLSNPMAAPFTANGLAISESVFQNLALNPAQNVVIEACAGSGKTWLLVARLLKLLLNGVPPAQIVAITFTRKAAQEMKQRLADMLDSLQKFDPQAQASSAHSSSAAALFAALGLHEQLDANARIQAAYEQCRAQGDWPSIVTFHEWFGELRQNAPISALANAGAALSDDEAGLIQQAWQQFWQDSAAQGELQTAMQCGVAALGLNGFEVALSAMLERRAEWLVYSDSLLIAQSKSAQANTNTSNTSNTTARSTAVQHAFVACAQPQDIVSLWVAFQALLPQAQAIASLYGKSSTKTALARAQGLSEAMQAVAVQNTAIESQDGSAAALPRDLARAVSRVLQPLSMSTGLVVNTKCYKDMLHLLESQFAGGKQGFETAIDALHAALSNIANHAVVLDVIPLHAAMLRCGGHLIAAYQSIKQAQGVMDFADLELDALTLLQQGVQNTSQANNTAIVPVIARHILLDEFQDTNPVQWQALQAYILPLLDEAKAGGQTASVFVVGDPKQSIYRFRRADPKLFSHVQRTLQSRYNAVLLKTQRTRRNACCINDWVNAVFVPNDEQLPDDALFSTQFTLSTQAGQVGALPLIDTLDIANAQAQSPQALQTEADQVVQALLAWKQRHPHKQWSDAMVLSRKRQTLAPIAAQLNTLGIATASADKGGFFALPEIADTLALLAALNNTQDALALLTALRSPLFAINNAQLSELLAAANVSESSHNAWLGIAQLDARWAQGVTAWLHAWQRLCSNLPMHDALDAMMHQGQWVQRFTTAHPERAAAVAANLAQLLQLSLAVDQGRYPSLPRFVQAVAQWRSSDQIAAQSAAKADAVLLSTIHSAKGLEADCVIMVDLYSRDKAEPTVKVLLDWQPECVAPTVFALQLCAASVLDAVPELAKVLQAQQAAQATERDTLLYVAMTRAVSELWISATPKKNANSMYERLRGALPLHATDATDVIGVSDASDGKPLPTTAQPIKPCEPLKQISNYLRLPPLHTQVPPNSSLLRLSPSADQLAQQQRMALGTLMHALLEHYLRHKQWQGISNITALSALALHHGVPADAAQHLLLQCQSMVEKSALHKLFEHTISHLAIEENLYIQGNTLRPDVVAYQSATQTAWIIDYKMGFDAADALAQKYATQLQSYSTSIQGARYTQTVAVILTLAGQCWTLQDGQWVLSPLPWV